MPLMEFLIQVIVWFMIYLIVRIIARRIGVSNTELGGILDKISHMQKVSHKHLYKVKTKKSFRHPTFTSKKQIIIYLKKDYSNYKKVDSLFNIYLFDNSNDKKIVAIRKAFSVVDAIYKDLIVEFMHDEPEFKEKIKDWEDKIAQIDVLLDDIVQKISVEKLKKEEEALKANI